MLSQAVERESQLDMDTATWSQRYEARRSITLLKRLLSPQAVQQVLGPATGATSGDAAAEDAKARPGGPRDRSELRKLLRRSIVRKPDP